RRRPGARSPCAPPPPCPAAARRPPSTGARPGGCAPAGPRREPSRATSGRSRSPGRRAASPSGVVSPVVPTATLWEEIVDALGAVNGGPHPGFRAVHAKGTVCEGRFTPTSEAKALSVAAHL